MSILFLFEMPVWQTLSKMVENSNCINVSFNYVSFCINFILVWDVSLSKIVENGRKFHLHICQLLMFCFISILYMCLRCQFIENCQNLSKMVENSNCIMSAFNVLFHINFILVWDAAPVCRKFTKLVEMFKAWKSLKTVTVKNARLWWVDVHLGETV